ncbi:MAG TPA: BTAD domain-containing putative transcriptional regulator, partial [Propionibacteriaceae bacterium]|nr:BTAD domain-containing putative transcriptional regulator [Propionibacteriaceae bacterium]
LWGDDPPANPTNALQGRISRLRHALEGIGVPGTLVAARGPGYLAAVDRDQVDAHRFAGLVQQARTSTGSPKAAFRLYTEALDLWRGPALADFPTEPWAVGEAARLEELRLAAVEERIDLALNSGRHGDLVDELEILATANPLRERLHAQLMLALYRSGRQADALAIFRRLQRTLDDELGLDPSEELRDLEQGILRQDPRLRAPARELPTTLTNLPVRVTSFVGREGDRAQLAALLGEHRLVSLTGPGGAGKTSLAVQVATDTAERFPDGVWLVRLAGVEDPATVTDVVAESVGAQRPAGAVLESLVGYLRDRSALVVLDNCEHLVQACAELAERLITSGPHLRLLVTSREPLRVPGEVQVAVPPLAVPPPDVDLDSVRDYSAVRLFLDRATAVNPVLRLDPDAAEKIGRICRQLDGLPLALELAAARAATLPLAELAARLDDRFRLLTGGARTAEARQKTLRATVDWSHQLLTDPEKVLFRRLSVFRGGWTLQAAEAVTADEALPADDILDLLGELVNRSLVYADTGEVTGRFRMLETLREYAAERADDAAESDWLAANHARYYTAFAEIGQRGLRGAGQTRWLQALRRERSNIDAALLWCHRHVDTDPDLGLRLVAAMGWFWYFTSNQHALAHIDSQLAASPRASAEARARAVQARSVVARPGSCIVHPSPLCAEAAAHSLEELDGLGAQHAAAYSRALLAVEGIAGRTNPDPAQLLAAAREAFGEAADRWGHALTLFVEMELHFTAGRLEEGRAAFAEALELFRQLDDHWGISAVQYHYGMALHRAGLLHEALEVYRSALSEGRIGLTNTVQYALANLGNISLLIGDLDGADSYFTSAHAVARELGADASTLALLGQGDLARLRGDSDQARDRYTAALARISETETPDWAAAALNGLGRLDLEHGDVDTAHSRHTRAWRLVSTGAEPTHRAGAAALEGLAAVAAARGQQHAAGELLATAAAWRQERSWSASPLELRDLEAATAPRRNERDAAPAR